MRRRDSGSGHCRRADGPNDSAVSGKLAQHPRRRLSPFRFPFSSSLIALAALGQTINIMTLGGLSLAVGILVDDATVEIENTNRNLSADRSASLSPAPFWKAPSKSQCRPRSFPRFPFALFLCRCSFLTGTRRSIAVPRRSRNGGRVSQCLRSYLLSRTLVPVMVQFLMGPKTLTESSPKRRGEQRPAL